MNVAIVGAGLILIRAASGVRSRRAQLLIVRFLQSGSAVSEALGPRSMAETRHRVRAEVLIVLGLSLGASAAYSVVGIIDLSTRKTALSHATTTINGVLNPR